MTHHEVLRFQKNSVFNTAIFIRGLLVFALFFLIPQNTYNQETGNKYFKNYSYKEDYEHQPQNWGLVQAKNGIIYVANQGGILEFDGVSWRVIYIPNYVVRSLSIDYAGTIYIGGKNEIGYLAPDPKGTLKYVPLVNHLNENYKNFGNVWKTHATAEGIYFRTSKFLFRWNSREIKVWKSDNLFRASFVCNEIFFVQQQGIGLMQMVNGSLMLSPGGKNFAIEKIWMMAPYETSSNTRTLLIGTGTGNFHLYDGKTARPFPTGVGDYLKKNKVYHGIRLASGDFLLATSLGGVVIMDRQGRLKCIIDKTSGLQDDDVLYVSQDNQGNLWLCLENGISKIEYASPFFIYDNRVGLPGIILSVVRYHNRLYVGTTRGVFMYRYDKKSFQPVPGISNSCWNLLSTENSILAATSNGVFDIKKKSNKKIINDLSFALLPSRRYPGLTWCGTKKGIIALSKKKDRWMEEYRFETIDREIRYIVEDKNGHLWLITSMGGVLKVDFPIGIDHPVVTWYETSHGLPGGRVYATEAAGHVMFATENGIFRFDEKNKVFIPDQTLGDKFAGGPDSRNVFRIAEDKNKNIWFHSESRNFQAIPGPGDSFTINYRPFLRIPAVQVNAIYPDPDGKTTWFASFDGLIRYDTTVKKNYRQNFRTLIRKVLVNGELVFNGYKNKNGNDDRELLPIFKYHDRNLHFEFAAPYFEDETGILYRCFLEGYDSGWSAWNKDTKKNYFNLDPGLYSFRVQALNIYQHNGIEDIFRFKVLPPWYKKWWAFLIYGIMLLLLMFLAAKGWTNKLQNEKQKLERTIKERTKEIHKKNEQLENQASKLEEMDKVKSRFFANISHEFRTPLTLIMGPLEQMLSDSREKTRNNTLNVMLKNTHRLLTLINQLLDLSRFDSGKMKLKASRQNIIPFIKGLLASFHNKALQCKLNLEFHTREEEIYIYYDAEKMEDVLQNLLINAVKFTPANGKITVSVFTDQPPKKGPNADFVNISVRDTGIGIPKEQLAQIFDRFYQANGLRENQHKGTGIGLALIKEIVLLHHGKIDVHSQVGKGSEFVIRLLRGHEHLEPDEIIDPPAVLSPPRKYKEIHPLNMIMESETGAEINGETGEAKNPENEIEKETWQKGKTNEQEKPIILVVEDHTDVRKYICDPLRSGYTVIEAVDGKEGITKAREFIPDLIISDIMMPEVDGYELCRELKRDIKTSHIPIILLTAKASEESIVEGLETGADDYITKPFNTKILMTRIKNLVELRQQLQQKIQKQLLLQPAEISVSSMDRKFIKELQDVIEKNLSDTLFSVEKLGKKLYMSRTSLYRKVLAITGETPREFIKSYRLKRGAQLLKSDFGNVNEVAFEVGFSSTSFFIKSFKERFHQSPRDYKEVSKQ